MAGKSKKKLTKSQISAIHDGLKKANFGDFKISALHLVPKNAAIATASDGPCHSVELPNGHWVIVCS